MQELVRLINNYIGVQRIMFPQDQVISILKESKLSFVNLIEKYNIGKSYFSVVIVFKEHITIITSYPDVISDFEVYDSNISCITYCNVKVGRPSPITGLERIIFVGEKEMICFWSPLFNTLVRKILSEGSEAFLLEPDYFLTSFFTKYTILPYGSLYTENERYKKFHDYITQYPISYVTNNSDFMFKHAFNTYDTIKKPQDVSIVAYLERAYTDFVYGYIETADDPDLHSRIIFDFWFTDIIGLQICDVGLGHIPCGDFVGQYRKFYFVLACRDKKRLLSGLDFLQCKYKIHVMGYEKSPTYFVEEFMHYKPSEVFFNTYFIGIFNSQDWGVYADILGKIRNSMHNGMLEISSSLEFEDTMTIEERHKLRFAYFRYVAEYPWDCNEDYESNNVPWLALPAAVVRFEKIIDGDIAFITSKE